ncbi:MAG: 4'-phosphopantetheinyl transferase superfamily protein [Salinibacter sp.]
MHPHTPHWQTTFQEPGAATPSVCIWRIRLNDLGDAPLNTLRPLTTPAEHARARRYRFDADRERHLAGRGLVRVFVARRHACPPQEVSIREGKHGKPHLNGRLEETAPLQFNIAHTENVVLAAFSQTHPVGIDVEALDRDADTAALAKRIFTDEERRRWHALPDELRAPFFFLLWTCKEAFLKALGEGLHRPPQTVECTFDEDGISGLTDAQGYSPPSPSTSADRWAVHPFLVADGLWGAVVRKDALPSSLSFADARPLVQQFFQV